MKSIRESASLYENPDSIYGYGIPNFFLAERHLSNIKPPPENNIITYNLFPNPAGEYIYLEIIQPLDAPDNSVLISFTDILGTIIKQEKRNLIGSHSILYFDDMHSLHTGLYHIKIEFPGGVHTIPFLKIK